MPELRFINRVFQTLAATLLAIAITLVSVSAQATDLNIAQSPLFLSRQLAPNVILTLDDSGSMAWAYVPDALDMYANTCQKWTVGQDWWGRPTLDCEDEGNDANPHFASSAGNPMYYNPAVTYTPPVDVNGNALTTSFTTAWINGFDHTRGSIDLSLEYEVTTQYTPSHNFIDDDIGDQQAAYYFIYDTSLTGCSSDLDDGDCYKKVIVSATSGPDGTDERQNFANWYSFYRTRNLATVSAASLAMAQFGGDVRVAWQNLHTCDALDNDDNHCDDWNGKEYDNHIAKFQDVLGGLQHRTDFYNWLFRFPASGGTPLRSALVRAGRLYTTSGINSPYAEDPQVTDGIEYACRQNYSIIMTDGLWNSDNPSDNYGVINTPTTLPDGTAYDARHPYHGQHSNDRDDDTPTLADIAFYYWSHDLRTDLEQTGVLKYEPAQTAETLTDSTGDTATLSKYWNPKNDPATWQHMVTFTVGLGLNSYLTPTSRPNYDGNTYTGDYPDLVTGNVKWPAPREGSGQGDPNNVADLWHAALASRGQFFGADTPEKLAQAFNTIIKRILGRTSSASAIAVNSTSLQTNTLIFQGLFNSGDWSGELNAFPISHDGNVDQASAAWQASKNIPAAANRKIFTYNPTTGAEGGISFFWANLTTTQQQALRVDPDPSVPDGTLDDEATGKARLKYLRGDRSNEPTFRTRGSVLGDIINSDPFFVGTQNYGDSLLPGTAGNTYAAWLDSKDSRQSAVYVGANDGMLHAFNAETGDEMFAFIPNAVFPNLSQLTSPDYVHHYYVDGGIMAIDAYVDTAASGTKSWHTILVGSTGAGARDIFALDVSSPAAFDANDVLWELSGSDDSDLGYVLGSPIIARLNSGQWVAIFGNGYNSTNQHAVLFVVDLATGTLIKKIDTGIGSAAEPNGLAQPVPVDTDGDRITDVVYAGDLYGNLWKFDLSDPDSANWAIAYTNSDGTPAPLFHASNGGVNQPITSAPAVGRDDEGNLMIFFGTGKYFEKGDEVIGATPPTQTLYGIKDLGAVVVKDDLLQQDVLGKSKVNDFDVYVTSKHDITTQKGWYLDLPGAGERIANKPIFRFGRIIFTSTIPNNDACEGGGTSWIWELNASNGSRLDISPFDLSDDDQFTEDDYATVTYTDADGNEHTVTTTVSAKQSKNGIDSTPAVLDGGGGVEYKLTSGSQKEIEVTTESSGNHGGRFSWRQIH